KNGDGVYGLRRALVLAGSETQMMSLWAVNDSATRDLMVSYYRLLKIGEGRSAALRRVELSFLTGQELFTTDEQRKLGRVQNEKITHTNRIHPYYWACFIQSGEWRNLAGQR